MKIMQSKLRGILTTPLFCLFGLAALSFPAEAANAPGQTNAVSPANTPAKSASGASARTNSFASPDFAYPQDVANTARIEFESALTDGKPVQALLAAMQLNVAANVVSSDSVGAAYRRYNLLAANLEAPWSSMALLLKARLLSELYNSRRYIFDNRVLPLDATPDPEPSLWSGRQLRQEIAASLKAALQSPSDLNSTPIADAALLLTDAAAGENEGMTLLDFAIYQSIDIGNTAGLFSSAGSAIPFKVIDGAAETSPLQNVSVQNVSGNSQQIAESTAEEPNSGMVVAKIGEGTSPAELLDLLIETHRAARGGSSNPQEAICCAQILKLAYFDDESARIAYANALLQEYPLGNSLRPRVMVGVLNSGSLPCDTPEQTADVYSLLRATVEQYPDSPLTACLKNQMASMTQPKVDFNGAEQVIPGKESVVRFTLSNTPECNLLLVALTPAAAESNKLTIGSLKPLSTPKLLKKITLPAEAPCSMTDSVTLPALSSGYYAIIPSANETLAGVYSTLSRQTPYIVNACSISTFVSTDSPSAAASPSSQGGERTVGEQRLYVVDASTGAPIKGAKVAFTSNAYSPTEVREKSAATTDRDGSVVVPFNNAAVVVEWHGNRLLTNTYNYGSYSRTPRKLTAQILTDLSIYHPGDELQCAVVVGKNENNLMSAASDTPISLHLINAIGKEVGVQKVVTDKFGRASATLTLPADGLTGAFRILAKNDTGTQLGSSSVQVAEYSAPSFIVRMDAPSVEADNSMLTLSGNVATYSGMPVDDAEVTVNIHYSPLWRWWGAPASVATDFSTLTTTNSSGRFELKLLLDEEALANYRSGNFSVAASAVAPSGETQESAPRLFSLSSGVHLEGDSQLTLKADSDSIRIPVKAIDMLGNPVRTEVEYTLVPTSKSASQPLPLSGCFTSPELTLSASELPSGEYTLTTFLPSTAEQPDTLKVNLIVWREGEKTPPVKSSLWIPVKTVYAAKDASTANVTLGNSYSSDKVYCQISGPNGIISRQWLSPAGKNISVQVPAAAEGERLTATFRALHDLQGASESVSICPASDQRTLKFKTVTMRDHLTPGAHEKWQFILSASDGPIGESAAIAVLSNAALNAIAPFNWSFSPRSILSYPAGGSLSADVPGSRWFGASLAKLVTVPSDCTPYITPIWNLWGGRLAGGGINIRGTRMMKMAATTAGAAPAANNADSADEEVVEMAYAADLASAKSEAVATMASSSEDGENESSTAESFREMEMPLAFFRPDLTPNEDGSLTIEFDTPDFNTTWALQLLGYDEQLRSTILRAEAVASKPVMVSTLMPRFLLTGDKAEITVTTYNNTDSICAVTTRIEVVDPTTGKQIASMASPEEMLQPSASRLLTVSFTVPSDCSALQLSAMAQSEAGTDGERGLVAVLPATQPVADATSFYINALSGASTGKLLSIRLPKMPSDASVTLNYCANPQWYVLTSLSGLLQPESSSALTLADALYANSVSTGIISSAPQIKTALASMLDSGAHADSPLLSPLEKNAALKIVAPSATPWVNNAENESARMASLSQLLDSAAAKRAVDKLISRLAELQTSSGGWAWLKTMPASAWITNGVLSRIASLRKNAYLPESARLNEIVAAGMQYYDKEMARLYTEWKRQNSSADYPLTQMVDFFLMRTELGAAAPTGTLATMRAEMLRRLPQEWRTLGIMAKANAAILCHRENGDGFTTLSANILESLKQTASRKSDKGMWIDATANGASGQSPLTLTAKVCEAFAEVDPKSDVVSDMCRYLILSRQTQDWNLSLSAAQTADVVNAVLGNIPANSNPVSPEIRLNGTPIEIPATTEALTGNFYMDIPVKNASGALLEINPRSEAPAWGGVLAQYLEAPSKVKAAAIPQLSVRKQLLQISAGQSGPQAAAVDTFRKGDRIRVTLTIINDRDMDYVVINDRMGAFMQPSDQLTTYTSQDGVMMMRETLTSATNFYIPRLPKGEHIFTYDVSADRCGEYATGIATVQSQYAPMLTAHSAGQEVCVTTIGQSNP